MGSDINHDSIVTVISYATTKLVLPGDNNIESWQELLGQNSFLEAIKGTDVFIASHHGLESGFCDEIFNYFHPKLVIVSNGRYNDDISLARYSGIASGLNVHTRSGKIIERRCLTTRSDGNIEIAMGWIVNGQKAFLSVTAD
jgi:competence protein ComEC